MQRQSIIAATIAFLAAASACAGDFEEYGRVVRVTERTETVNLPRQECRVETVYVERQNAPEGVGAIMGGIIGNQIGGGNGRVVATAVGAVIGDRIERNSGSSVTVRDVNRCYMVDNWQTRTTGYSVTYEYQGRTFTAILPYAPGDRIKLRVAVYPTR
ncbi:MAG TPA: glycine zipper 2TM domain-containing protein [Noviherbaspirillum sp.]|nr:glycine zipper 2TM domain-containing protein [Noviherbaspirillum sp.]